MGIGLIVAITVVGAVSVTPATASGLQAFLGVSGGTSSSATGQPNWNSGNLCSSISGLGTTDVNCVSTISHSPYPLTYNFSAGKIQYGVVNVWINGSSDCIYLNFHSFYTNITIHLMGSDYSCSSHSGKGGGSASLTPLWGSGGGKGSGCSGGRGKGDSSPVSAVANWGHGKKSCAPGVNIVVNSEGDTLNLLSASSSHCSGGGDYSTNVTIYGTTTVVNAVQSKGSDHINTTITYIGTKPGFSTCPSGITYGRVAWTEVSYGSHNAFNTIFVDGTNVVHVPPNSPVHSGTPRTSERDQLRIGERLRERDDHYCAGGVVPLPRQIELRRVDSSCNFDAKTNPFLLPGSS